MPAPEEDGQEYRIPDRLTETLAILLFQEDKKRDGSDETWFCVDAQTRETYRSMARGEWPLIDI